MQETFYSTTAQISFTLLGLWWVVVQFKHQEWMPDAQLRRMSYDISLYFLLPGIMSLLSLLAADAKFLWRIGFGLAGLLGLVETILFLVGNNKTSTGSSQPMRVGRWGVVIIYALIILVASFPDLVPTLGVPLKAIEVEGIMVALLIFLGVNFAWTLFAEPLH